MHHPQKILCHFGGYAKLGNNHICQGWARLNPLKIATVLYSKGLSVFIEIHSRYSHLLIQREPTKQKFDLLN